jgi:hypothetical protein
MRDPGDRAALFYCLNLPKPNDSAMTNHPATGGALRLPEPSRTLIATEDGLSLARYFAGPQGLRD